MKPMSLEKKIKKCELQNLCLPKGVTMSIGKASIIFEKVYKNKNIRPKRACLKANNMEFNNQLKVIADRIEKYTPEKIKNCHLGHSVCRIALKDYWDVQAILNKYFK